ncbi:MAG: phosphoadenylyl-sulfate reductase [Dehalococcoidia bacterium]|jgi:phosphoadenosine phosphosulfate reductase|nr:phosphoadenylyl-sulfate reductase [Chloroflexota bacterium]MDP6055481.1 phosphoadenylyl-sulfate reductase [Dehalococcoidia bacterium]MDP7089815.1 phosphoadenylyl-sulfate reductase [Dehalococcoidia bacterium]MDP7210308.1 phosphoadenylyl-sulfate reductase [Vicinamibacterales bacterium]MDP7486285.1 phosphoadenylyl-sulfate reductase [Dehalococcoidia bacterium]|tara:strand:- start:1692 stop:2432 length:741 start_codon:yes stop_codon:yes gene_type:complete
MPTTPRFTTAQLAEINKTLENGITEDILKWTNDTFGNTSAQMSSFGLEDQALFHIYWSVNPNARLMTLDTLRLPTETYSLFDQVKLRYGVDIEFFYPDMTAVAEMVKEKGNNFFYMGRENREFCCGVRKVEPLGRALVTLDAWVTGLRRDQGMDRGSIDIVEWDAAHNNYKINPLANWTFEQVQKFVKENEIPYNELHDQGYPSLGCAPCTRAIKPGEDIRAGRWWWEGDPEAKECGIHIVAPLEA